MSANICPLCSKPMWEELYSGTIFPGVCMCEPIRRRVSNGIETISLRHSVSEVTKKLCRNCKWWRRTPYQYGDCKRVEVEPSKAIAHGDLHTTEDFGCIQWEKGD